MAQLLGPALELLIAVGHNQPLLERRTAVVIQQLRGFSSAMRAMSADAQIPVGSPDAVNEDDGLLRHGPMYVDTSHDAAHIWS